jgi:hypothetical protein
MMNARVLAVCAFALVPLTHAVDAQSVARYRNFALKSDVATVASLTAVSASEARTIHERPALLQELEWRSSHWMMGSAALSTDPVEQIVFSFYNNQLYRLVVDYATERTNGLTDADMIEAISAVYGPTIKLTPRAIRLAPRAEPTSGAPVARWGDVGYEVVLYKDSSYEEAFHLIVTEPALADLARTAAIQGTRFEAEDAPRREIARLKQEQEDGRVAADKVRLANKAAFRP